MMADSKVGGSIKQASRDLKNAFLNEVCREIEYTMLILQLVVKSCMDSSRR